MQVAKTDLPGLNILFFDLAQLASGKLPAVRSLEVAELQDRNRGVRVTFEVPGLRRRNLH